MPINADTHRVPYLPNGKAYELQTWYTDGGRRPTSATDAVTSKIKDQGHKVTWLVWSVLAQWPINRKWILVVSPKLAVGYPMTRATLHSSFKVKRSKVRVIGRLMQTHKMCHVFWTARPKNFRVDFLAAAEYPDPPNFCRRRKSAGKIMAAVNAAEFVKFGEPPQKLRLTFGWVYPFTKPRIVYFAYWLQERNLGLCAKC